MIELQITGKCKGCPFMDLELRETLAYSGSNLVVRSNTTVVCKHEHYCDREEKENDEKGSDWNIETR